MDEKQQKGKMLRGSLNPAEPNKDRHSLPFRLLFGKAQCCYNTAIEPTVPSIFTSSMESTPLLL